MRGDERRGYRVFVSRVAQFAELEYEHHCGCGLDYELAFSPGMPKRASLYVTHLEPWVESVEASGLGRVSFDIYGLDREWPYDGPSDVACLMPDWAPGVFPILELAQMPMLFPDMETGVSVTWRLMEEYGPEYDLRGYHLLGLMFVSPAQWGGKVPVRSPGDLAGRRVRSGGYVDAAIIATLGGVAFEPGVESLETQLAEDRFDGLFLSWSFHAGNTDEWATDWTECDLLMRPLVLVMMEYRWEELPEVVRKTFDDNSGLETWLGYARDEQSYVYDNASLPWLEDRGLDRATVAERAEELGHPIYVLTDSERAEWRSAMQPVWQAWVERYAHHLPTQEILDRALELVEQYSAD